MEILKVGGRNTIVRKEILEINQEDARELGVSEGDWVEALTPRGRIGGVARLSGPQRRLVSTTMLFGQLITDLESSEDSDPMLKVPTFAPDSGPSRKGRRRRGRRLILSLTYGGLLAFSAAHTKHKAALLGTS